MLIILDPENPTAYHTRGVLRSSLGLREEALEDFDGAVRRKRAKNKLLDTM